MIKSILFFVIGAGAMYLYLHPGDVDGMQQSFLDATNKGATVLVEITKWSTLKTSIQVTAMLASLR